MWRAWLERNAIAVPADFTVSTVTAAQVRTDRKTACDSCTSPLIGWFCTYSSFFSQHATVSTPVETVTQTLVGVSAPPTQRESYVTDVRVVTGVMTPQLVVRYTHTLAVRLSEACLLLFINI